MKRVERILLKLVVIHGILLLVCQIFFHHYNTFPELKELILYEGVTDQNYSEILETFQSR